MKRNHKITVIAILAGLIAFCLVLAGCDSFSKIFHSHTYEDYWFSDETYHWKTCTECHQDGKKSKHTVDESAWTVVIEPSETQLGARRGKCSVCNAVVTEDIPKLAHKHEFAGDYVTDDLGHWKLCSCGEKGQFAEHTVTNWTTVEEPTENTQGQKTGQCSVCGKTITRAIPATNHTHSYAPAYDDDYHYDECSCGDKKNVVAHAYGDNWQTDAENHWKTCSCGRIDNEQAHITTWIVDTPATTAQAGSKREVCTVCNKTLRTETIDKLTSATRNVDFYAINDFHGEVSKISSVGGYLKERKDSNANTVLINSGDMFQGSMESNANYGKLLTDCMDVIGFDAFTYGNHEFDWGLNKLETLASNSNVPFLGANIYHWNASNKTWGTFASELAKEYTIVTLDNGMKVGIIGVIGKDQITSISSNLVQTIGFKDPLPIIKQLAGELRDEQNCDVVVVSAHASPRGLVGESEKNTDPEEPSSAHGLESYVDAVFCAHTHREQVFSVDGLTFIQGGSYGSKVSRVSLSVNSNGNVSCTAKENISYSNAWSKNARVNELVSNSNAQIAEERNQVVIQNLNSSLNANPAMARLVSRSIAEYAKNQGYNIALAMVNTARKSLKGGTVTYSDLYESIPFDNVVYIAKVKGSDIISEVNYGNYYWRSSGEAIESDKYYFIAVIDYLLFHQNSNRDYNYFRSAFTSGFTPVALTNSNYDVYNYRLITRDYLLNNSINAHDYIYDNNNTDTELLQSSVTLTYQTVGSWNGSGATPAPTPEPTPEPDPEPSETEHAGTLDDPYSVADALQLASDYASSENSPNGYVTGMITSGSQQPRQGSSSDDVGRIYIEDDDGNVIYVYWLSMFQGASQGNNWDWTGVDSEGALPNDLKIGDTVVIYANAMYTFYGTQQIYTGYCVAINGKPTA